MKPCPLVKTVNLPQAPDFQHESYLWANGARYVAGLDEAGRGALAGPVVAGAVIFPADDRLVSHLTGVRDSKQMRPEEREYWAGCIPSFALTCGVGFASASEIDRIGIVPATRLAMRRALDALRFIPEHLLLDFLTIPEIQSPQTPLVKGDARSLSIAAASIIAKTSRDAHLCQLDTQYPGYFLAQHKGYGTKAHRAALDRLGPSPIHRLTFKGVNPSP